MTKISIRLTKLTGKSSHRIHPKHLIKKKSLGFFSDFTKNDVVLDIGCSSGSYSIKLAEKVKLIFGLDYDKKSLDIANRRITKPMKEKISFKFVNIEHGLDFPESYFDKILFIDVIEHLNKRDYILNEIKRVLKKNGLMYLSAPNRQTSWKLFKKKTGLFFFDDKDHKIEYTKDELFSLFNQKKFEIISFQPIVFDFPLKGLFDLFGGLNLKLYKSFSDWKVRYVKSRINESSGFFFILKNIKQ